MNIAIVNPILRTLNYRDSIFFERAMPIPKSELAQINIVELAAALSDLGDSVTVYCVSSFLEEEEIHLNNRVSIVGVPARLMMVPRLVSFSPRLAFSSSLRSADLIQSGEFLQFSTLFASSAAARGHIPFIVWQEDYRYHSLVGRTFGQFYNLGAGKFIRSVTSNFVLRTKKAKDFLIENKVHPSCIGPWIPTGINGDTFQSRSKTIFPEDFGFPKDFAMVLVVARLSIDKGVDLAIVAMSILKIKGVKVGLLIRGSGPELNHLKALTKELKVEDRVRFVGRKSQLDMSNLYSSSDIFLLASRSDLFPFALLEASACGLPSVSTRVGCVEDFVHDGVNGILILPNSVDEIVKGIVCLLSNESLRMEMGRAAHRLFQERFELRVVAKRFSQFYHNLENFKSCNR